MRFFFGLLCCATLFGQAAPDYANDVHPLLSARCGACHGNAAQGGLNVTSLAGLKKGGASGPAISPGHSADSTLIRRITGQQPPRMPMGAAPLSDSEIAMIRTWIDAGATGSDSPAPATDRQLALHPPPTPEGPNPIDGFLKTGDRQPVGDGVFLRRIYFDIWGLPPSPAQLAKFQSDRSANKREQAIDTLLGDSARYTQNWISFWNDLLRNDEGVIYHGDRKTITKWLRTAIEQNMPYDQFVRALLNPTSETDPAGFLIGVNWRGDVSASELPHMQAAQNSAQVFLGINLKCNSCHDSFISRWKLRDAYGLASFFSEKPLEMVRCDVPTGEVVDAKFLYPELGDVAAGLPLAGKRAAAAKLFTQRENGRLPRTYVNRIWKRLFGTGLVEPVDDLDAKPLQPELLEWLAARFVNDGYDPKKLLRLILTSRAYQLPSVAQSSRFNGPIPRRLTAEQFADALSAITGEWRISATAKAEPGSPVREWQLKSTSLTRALGRPVRDYVTTERQEQATTLQMLELVNGNTLATQLRRGAERMLGQLAPSPAPLFDSGNVRDRVVPVDVDIRGATKLWLLLRDMDSYDPKRVIAGWQDAEFTGPDGAVTLSDLLKQKSQPLEFKGQAPANGVAAALNSDLVVDLAGKGFTRFRATVGVDRSSLVSDVNANVRFFAFTRKPDPEQLIASSSQTPEAVFAFSKQPARLVEEIFRFALSRDPAPEEVKVSIGWLDRKPDPEKLEDLLWALFLSPEFQYIR